METITDHFAHTSITRDDLDYLIRKHNLTYTLDNRQLTVSDGQESVKFNTVVDGVELFIFDGY